MEVLVGQLASWPTLFSVTSLGYLCNVVLADTIFSIIINEELREDHSCVRNFNGQTFDMSLRFRWCF